MTTVFSGSANGKNATDLDVTDALQQSEPAPKNRLAHEEEVGGRRRRRLQGIVGEERWRGQVVGEEGAKKRTVVGGEEWKGRDEWEDGWAEI